MAENVVAFFLGKLNEVLSSTLDLVQNVDIKILSLHNKLAFVRAFLKDADANRRDNERIKVWVEQVRNVAFRAEDAIDRYIYEVHRRRHTGFGGSVKNVVRNTSSLKIRYQLGCEIEEIRQMLQEITESKSEFGIEFKQSEGEASSSSHTPSPRRAEKLMPVVEETNVVGFEKDTEAIMEKLLKGDQRRAAVSIVGMGGLGKTTLARKVYDSDDVKKHFDCQTWIYVSEKYSETELLLVMLESSTQPDKEEIDKITKISPQYRREQYMKDKLKEYLSTRKYLLVIDDIWNGAAWDAIRGALPDGNNGSRIMVTTRKKEVAQYIDSQGFIHEPQCLNEGESWDLLCSRAFGSKDGCPKELQEIGKEMVSECAGLPLAITVLGGLLSRKPKTVIEWGKVIKRIKYELHHREDFQNVQRILALSYDDLPYYLRSCFLYLGLFPEDSAVDVEKLIQLWVAEGFIQARGRQTMEEVAEDYVEELVDRCMIQVVARNSWGRVVTCRIHDLLLDLCISEGEEDKFLGVVVAGDVPFNAFSAVVPRRVAIHGGSFPQYVSANQSFPKLLRSLLCSGPEVELSRVRLLINNVKLLRVLDLKLKGFIVRLPKQIGALVHLRYLGLEFPFGVLPSSVGKLRNLQTLRLGSGGIVSVPDVVWKIETLRHIIGEGDILMKWPTIRCNCKGNLQTLWGINAGSRTGRVVGEFANLRALYIPAVLATHIGMLCSSVEKLTRLNKLRLDLASCTPAAVHTLLAALSNHPVLYELILSTTEQHEIACRLLRIVIVPIVMCMIYPDTIFINLPCLLFSYESVRSRKRPLPQPDHHNNFHFPTSLTRLELRIEGLFCNQGEFASLESLPYLKILVLDDNAYIGKHMVFSPHGFPKLQELHLSGLRELEQWTIEDEAVPCLEHLQIQECEKLKMLPEGLQHVTTLQKLKLRGMPREFEMKIQKDKGGDWYKIQHISSIDID